MTAAYPDDTLGHLRALGMGLNSHGDNCTYSELVGHTLINGYGQAKIYIPQEWPLKCTRCCSPDIVVMVKTNLMG
ncbi:hypothetical protein SAMN06297251_112123 [Fulvimarina manganoxydans]|uniref:Uncharacterized protein n=1 Tax=Fulvimarina manganoxydans TaxID=937218 RepID=A0A1W2D4D8_9HYPH|nr:hypothetical protein [Fulvimarina manganoxydans]SMC92323.1 hypothetical protein SAMN06297251_112123 [Fulvimarina manganoxydans]